MSKGIFKYNVSDGGCLMVVACSKYSEVGISLEMLYFRQGILNSLNSDSLLMFISSLSCPDLSSESVSQFYYFVNLLFCTCLAFTLFHFYYLIYYLLCLLMHWKIIFMGSQKQNKCYIKTCCVSVMVWQLMVFQIRLW